MGSPPDGRDLERDAMIAVAKDMTRRYALAITVRRRRSMTRVVEGFSLLADDLLIAVRWRRPFGSRWHQILAVSVAASAAGAVARSVFPRSGEGGDSP